MRHEPPGAMLLRASMVCLVSSAVIAQPDDRISNFEGAARSAARTGDCTVVRSAVSHADALDPVRARQLVAVDPAVAACMLPESSGPMLGGAVAVNLPVGWIRGQSLGASAYVQLTRHLAARANVARYDQEWSEPGFEDITHGGRILDLGLGVVWYPRRLWNGPTVELGVLDRRRDISYFPESTDVTATHTTTVAGRALVG